MSNTHNERYDEIKYLLKKSRVLLEQETQVNVAKDLESRIKQDNDYDTAETEIEKGEEPVQNDKVQKYRISGGILALHGKTRSDLDITTDEKIAFQETMDEFVNEVSDLVDFNKLNVYRKNVEWSGKIIDFDIEFYFSIGEENGVYVDSKMVKVDEKFLELLTKLQKYYEKFKSKWSKVMASRKRTSI